MEITILKTSGGSDLLKRFLDFLEKKEGYVTIEIENWKEFKVLELEKIKNLKEEVKNGEVIIQERKFQDSV